jgi:hypothetical protein
MLYELDAGSLSPRTLIEMPPFPPTEMVLFSDMDAGSFATYPVISLSGSSILGASNASISQRYIFTDRAAPAYSAAADPQIWTKDSREVSLMLEDGITALEFEADVTGTVELEADQNYEALTVNSGTPPGVEFMGSRACAVCAQLYKYKDLVFFRGAYYGIPCGDYKDIKGILRREQDARYIGRSRDEQRSR